RAGESRAVGTWGDGERPLLVAHRGLGEGVVGAGNGHGFLLVRSLASYSPPLTPVSTARYSTGMPSVSSCESISLRSPTTTITMPWGWRYCRAAVSIFAASIWR